MSIKENPAMQESNLDQIINKLMLKCVHCEKELKGKYTLKFCSRSCSASFTNKAKVKHGKWAEKKCAVCKALTTNPKFCSKKCMGVQNSKYKTPEEKLFAQRIMNREANANYRAKLLKQTPPDVDRNAIKEFYINCPKGHEVDHIIPIDKGGQHTLSNLQYLTISENRKKSNKILA